LTVRERRALAGSGSPGYQHQSALFLRDLLQDGGQVELLEVLNAHRDDAKRHADRAALLERVAAEPAEAGDAIRQVHLMAVLELLAQRRRQHRGQHRHHVVVVQPLVLGDRGQLAAYPHHRIAAGLQVKVRRPPLNRDFQKIIDVHR
jgi:hypothetical protein